MEGFFRYTLKLSTAFSLANVGKGSFIIDGWYYPRAFESYLYDETQNENRVFFKQALLKGNVGRINWIAGKQYIKDFGLSSFFAPLDVINRERNLLKPKDEIEGIYAVNLNFLILNTMSASYYVKFSEEEEQLAALNLNDVEHYFRLGWKSLNLNTLGFVRLQKDSKLLIGLNFGYVLEDLIESREFRFSNWSLYGESLIKFESDEQRINADRESVTIAGAFFPVFLLGSQMNFDTPTTRALDGFKIDFEFIFDKENWDRQDFDNYNSLLDDIYADNLYEYHYYAGSEFKTFRNSETYFYIKAEINDFIKTDLIPSVEWVVNLTDGSSVLMPEVSYSFGYDNFVVGLKANMFLGQGKTRIASGEDAETDSELLPALANRSEFGSYVADTVVSVYIRVDL